LPFSERFHDRETSIRRDWREVQAPILIVDVDGEFSSSLSQEFGMNRQLRLRWIAAVTAAATALAIGQASAQTYYSSPDYGYDHGYGHAQIVRCESFDARGAFCRVNTQDRVRITRQLSHRACIQGYTWNYNDRGIWVSDGCRADFAVGYGRRHRHDYDDYSGYGYDDYQGGWRH
jgi:hypothetical protein